MELTVYEMIYEPFETSGEKPRSRKGGAKKNSDTLDDNDSSSDIGDSISAVAAKSYELQQAEEDGVGGHMSSHNNIDMEYEEDVKPDVEQLHSSAGKDLSLEQFMRGTCKFQCNLCKFETTVHSLFWEHVSNDHNMETEIYKDLHGKAYIKKSSKIECIVCYKHILHEPGAWSAHCRKTHGLDLFQFHEQYYSQVQQAADTVEDSPPAGRAPDGGDGGGSKAFNEWWNSGEKFDCQLCGKEQSTQKLLLRHIRGHGYSPDAYLEEFVKFQTRERTFSCQICRTDMSFNKTTVLLHLQKHSHRKPQDYFKMFINNGGKEEVKSCNVVGEGREVEEVVEAGKEDDGSSGGVLVPQTDHEDVLFIGRRSSITNSSASVVGKPKKKKVGRPPGSYTAVAPTKFDWEQGQRRCHLCPEMLGSIKAVHLHLKMKHPHSPTKRPKDLEESIQTHACLICEKMINFERIAVQQHLLGNHGMTLLEYEDKFQEGLKQIFSDLGVQY